MAASRHQQLESGAIDLGHGGGVEFEAAAFGQARIEPRADLGDVVDREFFRKRDRAHGSTSFDTASRICAGWNGLTIQALAPAARPSSIFDAWLSVVSMITGVNL